MTDTTLRAPALDAAAPTSAPAPAKARRLPFSPRTGLIVGAAVILAVAGATYIAAPKDRVSTDAAYVEADSSVVAPKVRGLIEAVLVAHNQTVANGDPLVRIDPEEFDARVASADADLLNAHAGVEAANAALVSLNAEEKLAAANIRAAQTSIRGADAQSEKAGADRSRYEKLVASGAVARRDADQFKAAAISAEADAAHSRAMLDVSQNQASVTRARRATLEANLAEANAAVARTTAALVLARQDQGHSTVTAPIAGVVGDRQAEPGDYVQPGTRLLTIVPLNALYVTANFKRRRWCG